MTKVATLAETTTNKVIDSMPRPQLRNQSICEAGTGESQGVNRQQFTPHHHYSFLLYFIFIWFYLISSQENSELSLEYSFFFR